MGYRYVKCIDINYGPLVPILPVILDRSLMVAPDTRGRIKVLSDDIRIGYTDLPESDVDLLNTPLTIVGVEIGSGYYKFKVYDQS